MAWVPSLPKNRHCRLKILCKCNWQLKMVLQVVEVHKLKGERQGLTKKKLLKRHIMRNYERTWIPPSKRILSSNIMCIFKSKGQMFMFKSWGVQCYKQSSLILIHHDKWVTPRIQALSGKARTAASKLVSKNIQHQEASIPNLSNLRSCGLVSRWNRLWLTSWSSPANGLMRSMPRACLKQSFSISNTLKTSPCVWFRPYTYILSYHTFSNIIETLFQKTFQMWFFFWIENIPLLIHFHVLLFSQQGWTTRFSKASLLRMSLLLPRPTKTACRLGVPNDHQFWQS